MQTQIQEIRGRLIKQAISFNKYWSKHIDRLEKKTTRELLCLIHPEERFDFDLELKKLEKVEISNREQILYLKRRNESPETISQLVGVSLSTVYKTIKKYC